MEAKNLERAVAGALCAALVGLVAVPVSADTALFSRHGRRP